MQGGLSRRETGFEEIGEIYMAEELKELLEKINEEGIKAAEEKASEIRDKAERQARSIVG